MRTEEQILKDFENWGYEIDNNKGYCNMVNEHFKKNILINKNAGMFISYKLSLKAYETIINGTQMETSWFNAEEPSPLSIPELKLLYELFACWGWLNE